VRRPVVAALTVPSAEGAAEGAAAASSLARTMSMSCSEYRSSAAASVDPPRAEEISAKVPRKISSTTSPPSPARLVSKSNLKIIKKTGREDVEYIFF
jgi:hypothetical protein